MRASTKAPNILLPIFVVCLYAITISGCRNANDKVSNFFQKKSDSNSVKLIPLPEPTPISVEERNRYAHLSELWYQSAIAPTIFNGGILVAYKGNIVFERYKGSNPLFGNDSLGAETPLHIASVSKTFTAMAILKLYEEGKLKLTDSLQQYFPDFGYPGVTIHSLLTHRSGLPNYMYFAEKLGFGTTGYMTNQDVLNVLCHRTNELPAVYKPNTRFAYNNTNYALLALLIEKVSGVPYPKWMQDHIFKPYGMKNTFVYAGADTARATLNYDWKGSIIENNLLDGIYGDKNIYSTPKDLFIWDRVLSNKLFLNDSTLQLAYAPYSNERPGIKNYGLGWRMDIFDNGKKLIFHTGWWHGNTAIFIRLLDHDATIIAVGNRFSRVTYGAKWLANMFDQYFTAPPEEEVAEGDSSSKGTIPIQLQKKQDTLVKKKSVSKKPATADSLRR